MTKLTKKDKERLRSVGYNRGGYKTSTETTQQLGDDGKPRGTHTEHFSGRIDANVTPKAIDVLGKPGKVGDG